VKLWLFSIIAKTSGSEGKIMKNPYPTLINLVVFIIFIFAFITAEAKGKIIVATIMALLFILPYLFPIREVEWASFAGKVIFSIGCYLYIKMHGFLKR
jgi:hypothetical protein